MVAKNGFYPLSYPQKGIWYLEKMYPNTSLGNITATMRFETKLDVDAANLALNHIVKTNEALRFRITEIDGEVYQYVTDYTFETFDFVDFTGKDISELYKWDTSKSEVPIYGLDKSLYHFTIIKINENISAFIVKLHHLVSDAWTLVSVGNEFMENYDRIINNQELDSELRPSYIEYLSNEEKYFTSKRFKKDEVYWLEKFDSIPELTTFKDRKLATTSLNSNRMTFKLPEKLAAKIQTHCEGQNTSLFSLYMGAMAVYFNRTKGLDKVVFGTPVLNRSNYREKQSMGMYISTVPILIKINDKENYTDFTKNINHEWMTLLRHQKYPYMLLLKNLREKNPGLERLYDIVISYQNAKVVKTENRYQEGRWHQNPVQTETLYIHINDREDDGDIIINYDYLSELFYPKEIEFLHDHIIRLLWHLLDNPERQLPFVEMISENEKKKILYEFNDTDSIFRNRLPIHRHFEKQARKTPGKTALVFNNKEMSYKELNKKANQIAYELISKGIGPGDIVGFMLPRSTTLIATMLGILKAGAAYMPIDKNFPIDRVSYILNNSNAKAILTLDDIFNSTDFNGYIIDVNNIFTNAFTTRNPATVNQPRDPACIIYTSGSTGRPKGVEISHRNLFNFIPAMTSLVDFNSSKTFISITSESFDIFLFETLLPLTQGLRVIMTNENEQRIPQMLHELLQRYKVDMLQTTPTRMNYILNHLGHYAGFDHLQDIILGGEVFNEPLLKKLKKITNARIYNGYGPSETTIYATFKELTNSDIINIGRPTPNTRIYIVDKYLNLMPIGTVGELCISGSGVMTGYIGNKTLNDEKLIDCPFEDGTKMFRTGDLAIWFGEGEIEYVGRNDNQVKVNGMRIEFGEIETQLLENNNIKETAVTVWKDDSGKPQICAYYIADNELSIKDLRKNISEKLPSYMIPSHYVRIDTMPLTGSGKINRALLPEPAISCALERKYEPPRDKLDHLLTKSYSTILKFSDIGINDHFFELGGDSLGVIELVSLLYKKGFELTISDVYSHPIVRELKKQIKPNRLQIVNENSTKKYMSSENNISTQIKSGSLPELDCASLTYIPENHLLRTNLFSGKPVMYKHMGIEAGNIGIIALPLTISQLYSEKEKTITLSTEAIKMAYNSGAKVISLTGLIPSATNIGADIEEAIAKAGIKIKVTTGHATTTATIILSLIRLLEESNRVLPDEDVCILGIGSIGTAAVKLMLSVLPHPATLVLCDLPSRMGDMLKLKTDLKTKYSFKGTIRLAYSDRARIPDEVYNSTLILGATNAANVLQTNRLVPGTLLIDDSGPHCISPVDIRQRFLLYSDIIMTEGGVLEDPGTIINTLSLPDGIDQSILSHYKSHFTSKKEITGCILSGLLSATDNNIKPTIGKVKTIDSIANYDKLTAAGYKGSKLHFEGFELPYSKIKLFNSRYNQNKSTEHLLNKNGGN